MPHRDGWAGVQRASARGTRWCAGLRDLGTWGIARQGVRREHAAIAAAASAAVAACCSCCSSRASVAAACARAPAVVAVDAVGSIGIEPTCVAPPLLRPAAAAAGASNAAALVAAVATAAAAAAAATASAPTPAPAAAAAAGPALPSASSALLSPPLAARQKDGKQLPSKIVIASPAAAPSTAAPTAASPDHRGRRRTAL
jgi:hypothetical protein